MTEKKESNNPADPWSMNYFTPPNTGVKPLNTPRRGRPIPDQDALFAIQKDLVKAINALDNLEDDLQRDGSKVDIRAVRVQVENSYKILNRYLREHSTA